MPFVCPEKAVADALAADAAVAAIIGDRIFPVLAPQTAALPFATWRRQAVVRETTLGNTGTGLPTVTLALELYAATYYQARELADACRAKLQGWGTSVANSPSIRHVSLVNESDGFVTLAGGDLPEAYSVTQTYTILWQEI